MVKIVEFNQPMDNRFDYDVVDDVSVFMRNDPVFYRKQFFPTIAKIADSYRAGKKLDKTNCLGEMIESALDAYCKKYNIAKLPDEIFNDNDRLSLIDKIFAEEIEQIKKGEYK